LRDMAKANHGVANFSSQYPLFGHDSSKVWEFVRCCFDAFSSSWVGPHSMATIAK
jgi:hypothetical protein